jgi:hypothetical protein
MLNSMTIEPTSKKLADICCRSCGVKLAETDGSVLFGPSFNLKRQSWLYCNCGAYRYWTPVKCPVPESKPRLK